MTSQLALIDEVTRVQAKYFKGLALPSNEMGLPTGFWLPDVVISAAPAEGQDPPDEAWQELSYAEGFPTVGVTGIPFWERLPNEPVQYFAYFTRYLEQEGARTLHTLFEHTTKRLLQPPISGSLLHSLHTLYYWEVRARTYELFKEADRARFRVERAHQIEASQLEIADDLVKQAQGALGNDFTKLNERTLVELLKMGIALQRISVGLPANGVKQVEGQTGPVDIRTLMLSITQNNVQTGQVAQDSEDMLKKAFQDPETVDLAQRLALKLQGTGPDTPMKVLPSSTGETEAAEIVEADGALR